MKCENSNGWKNVSKEAKSKGGKNGAKAKRQRTINDFNALPWEELMIKYSLRMLKQKILQEQNFKCNRCGIDKWNDDIIVLQLHHKDGNNKNNNRDNLECLCPNCHTQTDTYGVKGHKWINNNGRRVLILNADVAELVDALDLESSINL